MNQFLYLDNFRGFSDTYIAIEDVNFLVGENSTGKTSVLGLLQTISSESFLEGNEFRGSRINFGSFSDIVSAHAEDREYFRVGMGWENELPTGRRSKAKVYRVGLLATYVKSDGHDVMPRLRELTISNRSNAVSIRLRPAQEAGENGGVVSLKYRILESQAVSNLAEMKDSVFPDWVKIHADQDDSAYTAVAPDRLPAKAHTMMFLSMALHDLYTRSEDSEKKGGLEAFAGLYPVALSIRDNVVWIAPIRTRPRRIYDNLAPDFSPEGEHTPYVLRRMLHPKQGKGKESDFRGSLRRIGKNSGLFESVQIKNHGDEATAPFEVDAVLDGEPLNLCTVGYGVSQSLPVLVEILTRVKGSCFAIQQPEVHLHPRAQATLGDALFLTATKEGKQFLVETHSDFMIDRFRMNLRDSRRKKKPRSQILFFERKNRQNVVTPIRIDENGELPSDQPSTYRKFFLHEELRLLRIK